MLSRCPFAPNAGTIRASWRMAIASSSAAIGHAASRRSASLGMRGATRSRRPSRRVSLSPHPREASARGGRRRPGYGPARGGESRERQHHSASARAGMSQTPLSHGDNALSCSGDSPRAPSPRSRTRLPRRAGRGDHALRCVWDRRGRQRAVCRARHLERARGWLEELDRGCRLLRRRCDPGGMQRRTHRLRRNLYGYDRGPFELRRLRSGVSASQDMQRRQV